MELNETLTCCTEHMYVFVQEDLFSLITSLHRKIFYILNAKTSILYSYCLTSNNIIDENSKLYHEILGDMMTWLLEIVQGPNAPLTLTVKENLHFAQSVFMCMILKININRFPKCH
jgi:hypothetical protein